LDRKVKGQGHTDPMKFRIKLHA